MSYAFTGIMTDHSASAEICQLIGQHLGLVTQPQQFLPLGALQLVGQAPTLADDLPRRLLACTSRQRRNIVLELKH